MRIHAGTPARLALAALIALAAPVLAAPAAGAGAPGPSCNEVTVITVPPVPGLSLTFDGQGLQTDAAGEARLAVPCADDIQQRLTVVEPLVPLGDGVRARLARTFTTGSDTIRLAFDVEYLTAFGFRDSAGRRVDPRRVQSFTLRSSIGQQETFTSADGKWLKGSRVVSSFEGPKVKRIYYTIERALVSGSNVVHRAQQRFYPADGKPVQVDVLFYTARFHARDALFGFPVGRSVQLAAPDGAVSRVALRDGKATVADLPRGDYDVVVDGPGLKISRPIALSRDQDVDLKVYTWLDIVVIVGGLLVVALGLLVSGRPGLRPRLRLRNRRRRGADGTPPADEVAAPADEVAAPADEVAAPADEVAAPADEVAAPAEAVAPPAGEPASRFVGRRRVAGSIVALATAISVVAAWAPPAVGAAVGPAVRAQSDRRPIPVLAYYYIWFNASSWNRAKTDYPQLGRYSSDESSVMRTHIRLARAAGITGFLVSWKATPQLNDRLARLIKVAEAEKFSLGIVYQGLDFERRPLPPQQVAADLDVFLARFAASPVFQRFDKPLVVWAGTWKFGVDDIATVTGPRRDRLLILASDRSAEEYGRLEGLVDGDAYYWSSVDPTSKGYQARLRQLGQAVHARGGLWLAPAAPGFDARLVGGRRAIPRRGGETLRIEMNAALGSSPDAVGLISWNEFSENSHVEPSERFGGRALEVLRDIQGASGPGAVDFDSSEPGRRGGAPFGLVVLGFLVLLIFACGLVIARRAGPSA